MKGGHLDWSWFDPVQCWEPLRELWMKGRVRSKRMHHSVMKNESGHPLTHDLETNEERLWPSFPWNAELRAHFGTESGMMGQLVD